MPKDGLPDRVNRCNPKKASSHEENQPATRKGIFVGETSRTLYERANEHYKDAGNFSEKSHMLKHWMIEHPDEQEFPEGGLET